MGHSGAGLYKIITYGCQMNVHESEKLAGILVDSGYSECQDAQDADVVVFNTCCVRETAEHKAHGNIGALKKLKQTKPETIIAVCGCMTQSQGAAKKLAVKFPFLDIVFGTHNLHEFSRLLRQRQESGKRIVEVWESEGEVPKGGNYLRSSGINAWVNIMYGCNNFCTYCIVPYVRGRERSRPFKEIIDEVRGLIDDGYKEITLLGQNVNSYGLDLSGNFDFSQLLAQIAQLPGVFRLKFMTSHPKDFNASLIDAIAKYPKISKSIHLPVQSGSSRILKDMNRGYKADEYLEKVKKLKQLVPECGITTDIMVGFPGETDDDFNQTLKLLDAAEYSSCYSFIYSPRSGTPAADMENQIPAKIKKQRIMQLIQRQNGITAKLNASRYAGKVFEVLVDGKIEKDENLYCGRTDCGRLISFYSDTNIIGNFVNVKIQMPSTPATASLQGDIV